MSTLFEIAMVIVGVFIGVRIGNVAEGLYALAKAHVDIHNSRVRDERRARREREQ